MTTGEFGERRGSTNEPIRVAPGFAYLRDRFVNVAFIGSSDGRDEDWVLVDAGVAGSPGRIVRAAELLYGPGAVPTAIVLTHGHFDHVGALPELVRRWDVPVYAHELELPYLTGRSAYPPPDPAVGGGGVATLSRFFPRRPIDLGGSIEALPDDETIPGIGEWRWLHTAGHSPGHVSLFRDYDRALVAGDAFVTTKQESLASVFAQRAAIHGPPAYYTMDWHAAERSVRILAALEPNVVVSGHGAAIRGARVARELHELSREFARDAVPRRGRYVRQPARADRTGVVFVPPPVPDVVGRAVAGVAAAAAVAAVAFAAIRRRGG